ncbi:hypothetical protein QL093DRAFT_2108294 [Fusarium oxysporum]|nr:hypothetical protein QL093DRAFT_2108294 [Fusarium oxysporum]
MASFPDSAYPDRTSTLPERAPAGIGYSNEKEVVPGQAPEVVPGQDLEIAPPETSLPQGLPHGSSKKRNRLIVFGLVSLFVVVAIVVGAIVGTK